MALHHIFAGLGVTLPLISGFGAPAIATNLLMTENSSVFLEIRGMLPKAWRAPSWPGQFIDVAFFLTFTVFRILLMPLLIYFCYEEMVTVWPIIGAWAVFTLFPSLLAVCLYGLHLFWYVKILRVLNVLPGGENVAEDEN